MLKNNEELLLFFFLSVRTFKDRNNHTSKTAGLSETWNRFCVCFTFYII